MSLSDRIRPNSEAAPWVIVEVQQMEKRIAELEAEIERWRVASSKLRAATEESGRVALEQTTRAEQRVAALENALDDALRQGGAK